MSLVCDVVDDTSYPSFKPDFELSKAFARNSIPEEQRIKFVEFLQTAAQVRALATDSDTFAARARTIMADLGPPPPNTPQGVALDARWGAVWNECKFDADHAAKQAEKILEDPLMVPRISEGDIGEKLAQFADSHPDILLTAHTRPHHHLFELVRRDYLVHGLVKNYKIGQLVLESDGDVRTPVFSNSVSDLVALRLLQETEVQVRTTDSVLNRVQALFIVLDCLQIAKFEKDEPLWLYMKEFREKSAEHPTPVWAVKADQLLRKAAYKLQTEKRHKFRQYGVAIKAVLEHHQHVWSQAIMHETEQRYSGQLAQFATASQAAGSANGGQEQFDADWPGAYGQGKRSAKRARWRENKRARRDGDASEVAPEVAPDAYALAIPSQVPPAPPPPVDKGKGRGKGKGKGQGKGKGKQKGKGKGKNRDQFQRLVSLGLHPQTRSGRPICPYFNISSGCMHGESCQMLHECALCPGSQHSWSRAHPNQAAV